LFETPPKWGFFFPLPKNMTPEKDQTKISLIKSLIKKRPKARILFYGVQNLSWIHYLIKSLPGTRFYLADVVEQDSDRDKILIDLENLVNQNSEFSSQIALIRADSNTILEVFGASSLDLIYLNHNFSYEGTLDHYETWLGKVKSGGWISGSGYLNTDLQTWQHKEDKNCQIWDEDGVFLGNYGVNLALSILTEKTGKQAKISNEFIGSWAIQK
jgi:hypothetical protein